jgi:hypothetical protein
MHARNFIEASEHDDSHSTGRIYESNPVPVIHQLAIEGETIYGMTEIKKNVIATKNSASLPLLYVHLLIWFPIL